ncbi:MAG: hypothetical protein P4M00_16305, partial [Azospirillaceae bacterium]|nr:hypothetical protein [Azospirillaceae bacterium]
QGAVTTLDLAHERPADRFGHFGQNNDPQLSDIVQKANLLDVRTGCRVDQLGMADSRGCAEISGRKDDVGYGTSKLATCEDIEVNRPMLGGRNGRFVEFAIDEFAQCYGRMNEGAFDKSAFAKCRLSPLALIEDTLRERDAVEPAIDEIGAGQIRLVEMAPFHAGFAELRIVQSYTGKCAIREVDAIEKALFKISFGEKTIGDRQ